MREPLQYQICTTGPRRSSLARVGSPYHQFCPVAKAMELLDERWTLLVVRELISGSEQFNQLRRGLPRMSPTLLSRRLTQLERAGLLERRVDDGTVRYLLTPAGQELRPVVEAVGAWGVRWVGELGDRDLDPKLLLWDMHRNVVADEVPPGKTVVAFRFSDVVAGRADWWLVIEPQQTDVCDSDPGLDVVVRVDASLRALVAVWLGDRTWTDALRTGDVALHGPEELRRGFPAWFRLSPFAQVPRVTVPAPVG